MQISLSFLVVGSDHLPSSQFRNRDFYSPTTMRKKHPSLPSPGLYNCFLWFFIHKLRQQNTKLPKKITIALANAVYIRRNRMHIDCFPLSKYLPM